MADGKSLDCPCSNISIMQLFHELKQRYPSVPDQVVSKVILENCHNKSVCEEVLEKENRSYLQTYPGAIISGTSKGNAGQKSVCSRCRNFKESSEETCTTNANGDIDDSAEEKKVESTFYIPHDGCIYLQKTKTGNVIADGNLMNVENKKCKNPIEKLNALESFSVPKNNSDSYDKGIEGNEPLSRCNRENLNETCFPESALNAPFSSTLETNFESSTSVRTHCDCDFIGDGSHCGYSGKDTGISASKPVHFAETEVRGKNCCGSHLSDSACSGSLLVHNYQVAVQYSVETEPPAAQDRKRSFTTVNLNVRPPSSDPQPPIEIQSGQNLSYSSSVFDAKNGVQSNFQIVIGPGCGGAMPTFRTCISSPESQFSSFGSSCCSPKISTDFRCHSHRLKALIEKQTERKNRLARELRREQDKLRHMQNEVRLMKASIAQKPSPHILPKLKTEIERLRAECEKLTAAVDLFSDTQNVLPLGETDEQFYRNIYTGQRLQREGSWSCQLCTFRNHPLLNVCEECEMPRISLGSPGMDVASPMPNVLPNSNTSFCTGGGTSTSGSLITAPLQDENYQTHA